MLIGMCVRQLRACAQFPGCQLSGSRSDDAPGATGTPARRPWALTSSPSEEQRSLGKRLIPELGQERRTVSLELLVVLESERKEPQKRDNGGLQRDTGCNQPEAGTIGGGTK